MTLTTYQTDIQSTVLSTEDLLWIMVLLYRRNNLLRTMVLSHGRNNLLRIMVLLHRRNNLLQIMALLHGRNKQFEVFIFQFESEKASSFNTIILKCAGISFAILAYK